ncbi:hypothetical protein [Pseudooctadecabacter jejudonensis]|uniref:Uncharacterized protein n=1 Tax=Pseudooctadecabacter jejudonensis TaxID=1391910 RepID=A0A1Y5S5E9_9RHOB|nr:hypothetical protein [Pseudooctadecabacter jejudonensis]SLN32094.1 hypothetical protein PSJ8397_01498 [Pseudooctadecabacter jejudonensis]
MAMIADILLMSGALAATLYCYVLSKRLRQFTDLEKGVGGAVAILAVQVDELSKALERAEAASTASANGLAAQSQNAEAAAKRLELLMASLHDLPDTSHAMPSEPAAEPQLDPFFVRQPRQTAEVE